MEGEEEHCDCCWCLIAPLAPFPPFPLQSIMQCVALAQVPAADTGDLGGHPSREKAGVRGHPLPRHARVQVGPFIASRWEENACKGK